MTNPQGPGPERDALERGREIVSEWLRADFRGDIGIEGRALLEQMIAAAIQAERERALDDALQAVLAWERECESGTIGWQPIVERIRALAKGKP